MIDTEEVLKKIGITRQETKVYLALLELQEAQTGKLCKYTKIASSNIYNILDSLMKKGLISYRVQNNIKVFMPSPPEILNELFLEKQKKLDQERKEVAEIISNLKKTELPKEPYSNYKYFEGIIGIKAMWHKVNQEMNPEQTERVYTAKKESYERLVGFYTEHHYLRVKKKVKSRMIFPKEDKALAEKRINEFTQVKFMDLKNEAEWGTIGDNFFIQYLTSKKPRAFLITDKIFSETFNQVFDELWEKGEE